MFTKENYHSSCTLPSYHAMVNASGKNLSDSHTDRGMSLRAWEGVMGPLRVPSQLLYLNPFYIHPLAGQSTKIHPHFPVAFTFAKNESLSEVFDIHWLWPSLAVQ